MDELKSVLKDEIRPSRLEMFAKLILDDGRDEDPEYGKELNKAINDEKKRRALIELDYYYDISTKKTKDVLKDEMGSKNKEDVLEKLSREKLDTIENEIIELKNKL